MTDWKEKYQSELHNQKIKNEKIREKFTQVIEKHEKLSGLVAEYEDQIQDLNHLIEEIEINRNLTYRDTLMSLVDLFEFGFDESNTGFSRRVADHAHVLAIRMGLSVDEVNDTFYAALLCNVIQFSLSDDVHEPGAKIFDTNEKAQKYILPMINDTALMTLKPLQNAAKIIRSHKERYDGKGFPEGLAGDKIPISAQILAICLDFQKTYESDALEAKKDDVAFDALQTSKKIRENLQKEVFQKYNPLVVNEYLKVLEMDELMLSSRIEKKVVFKSLVPGMILSRHLLTQNGMLLLPKSQQLTSAQIDSLIDYQIKHDDETLYAYVKT